MPGRWLRPLALASSVLALAALAPPALSAEPLATTGAFRNVGALGKELQRGRSTKHDVRRLLGAPNGQGDALFPEVLLKGRFEIWYYEDVELTGVKPGPARPADSPAAPRVQLDMRQQILLLFFKGETLDGYFWTSNDARTAAY